MMPTSEKLAALQTVFHLCTPKKDLAKPHFYSVLWIRIHFFRIRIRIQSLTLETNTDPDSGSGSNTDPGL